MRKRDVIEFFDQMASHWDADLIRNDDVINTILDNAGVKPGVRVLDVACGTGVLFPDYLARGVESITAVDISPEMVRIAREKFPQENVTVLCDDVQNAPLDEYDVIMVYNAFPHFPEPEELIKSLVGHLAIGGRLSIAHGQSREKIDGHHKGHSSKISVGLMSEHALAGMMRKYLDVEVKISNDRMYQVTGVAE